MAELLDQKISGGEFEPPPRESAFGSLLHALLGEEKKHFQPTNINFGLFPSVEDAAVIEWCHQTTAAMEPAQELKVPKKELKRNFKEAKRDLQLARAKSSFESWMTKMTNLRGESFALRGESFPERRCVEHAT